MYYKAKKMLDDKEPLETWWKHHDAMSFLEYEEKF